jgi:spoIIIJ-associated protein
VETHSEGEEPYRKVVISLKKGVRPYNKFHNNRGGYGNNNRGGYGNKKGGYGRNAFNKKSNKPREPYRYGNIEEGEVYEGVTATIDPSEQI